MLGPQTFIISKARALDRCFAANIELRSLEKAGLSPLVRVGFSLGLLSRAFVSVWTHFFDFPESRLTFLFFDFKSLD